MKNITVWQYLTYIFLIFVFFVGINNASARTTCDAILQYGIFDRSNTLDQRSKYELVKNAHCNSEAMNSSSSGGLGYGELFSASGSNSRAESRNFCSSSFNEFQSNRNYWNVVSQASSTIASAWQNCIRDNTAGVSHYIEPTSDPSRFTYKIQYTPDGLPYKTNITSWTISGESSCKEIIPAKGQPIDSSGYEIQCSRLPTSAVIVTANTASGSKNLRRVFLPAHRENIPPPVVIPSKTSFSLDGKLYRSIGYWSKGRQHTVFGCPIEIPDGYELVIVSTTTQNIGRRRGACVTNFDYCNGHEEHCVEEFFSDACLVNKSWHDWYKTHSNETGIPYNKQTVCQ